MTKHTLNKLSARRVTSATKPGRYGDGGGLYLVVTPDGSRRWVYRFVWHGRQRDMGLGAMRDVPLAEARAAAAVAREHVRAGRDPIAERERARRSANGVLTFGEMADQLLESIEPGFRSASTAISGGRRLANMRSCSGRSPSTPLRPKMCSNASSRSGRQRQKPPRGFAAEFSASSTRRGPRDIEPAKIRLVGEATSICFCQSARNLPAATLQRCHSPKFRIS